MVFLGQNGIITITIIYVLGKPRQKQNKTKNKQKNLSEARRLGSAWTTQQDPISKRKKKKERKTHTYIKIVIY